MGILVYEMLAGKNPFQNPTYHSVVAAILERDPEPLTDVGAELWSVVERAMRKKPEDRFNNASELAVALRKAGLAQGATLNYDPERSVPPTTTAFAQSQASGQAGRLSSPGLSPGLAAGLTSATPLDAEPVIPLKRGRVSDPTELSIRSVEKRVGTKSRWRLLVGIATAGIGVLLIAGVVWKATRSGAHASREAASSGAVATEPPTTTGPAPVAATEAPNAAAAPEPTGSTAPSATSVAATATALPPATAVAAWTSPGGSTSAAPSARVAVKPPSTGKAAPPSRATGAAAAPKSPAKTNGVIKDPGF
jgi:serine/threonine-protein kinase